MTITDEYLCTVVDLSIEWDTAMRNKGHVPVLYDDGTLDYFAFNPIDPHNGPRCLLCNWGTCWHCHTTESIPECSYVK